jgi:nucleoside-diphosphate-sugar epimerase
MESDYTRPMNIGSDRMISIDGLADIIIGISGKDLKKVHDLSGPEGVKGRNADLTLMKEVLAWQPRISLEVGLANTYHWIHSMIVKDKEKAGIPAVQGVPVER